MSAGAGRLPDFLIVGAMKSGTTSLSRYLDAHPAVHAAPRELHFFDRNFEKGVDWYRSQLGTRSEKAVGESTPDYLYFPAIAARLARVVPGALLVAVLRDPVDRAYSHYWHNRTRGHEPLAFEAALEAEDERVASGDERIAGRYAYLGHGRYCEQLRNLAGRFPADQLAVLLTEDLRDDPLGAVRSLYERLGVDPAVSPRQVGQVENRFVRYRSERLRGPIRRLPPPLRQVAGRLNARPASYPPMDPETRARLRRHFAGPNAELAEWLGRPLDSWSAGA